MAEKGNFISEWFGQRIYPEVRLDATAVALQRQQTCPFLSGVLKNHTACVKSANSSGVCSINTGTDTARQDWLVCPYRVIDSPIVRQACKLIFGIEGPVDPKPVSLLEHPGELHLFKEEIRRSGQGYLFFQDKLGGEISVVGTRQSPELAFDITLVEIKSDGAEGFAVSRFGILEIQTMDFHGTYKHAVNDLRDASRLHKLDFPEALQGNLDWACNGIEGPNIANVFKRTFYQVMLKFQLAGSGPAAAGTVLALPRSVWESWQPFLGAPELETEGAGLMRFSGAAPSASMPPLNSFICVFGLDSSSPLAVSPVEVDHFVRVSPERLAHQAFTAVPNNIIQSIGSSDSIRTRICSRLTNWWPDFPEGHAAQSRSRAPTAKVSVDHATAKKRKRQHKP